MKARLTSRLGSADLAGEALHETWLRLARAEAVGPVRSPDNYLFRILLNAVEDRRRSDRRLLSAAEVDALLHVADDAPGPARIAEARSDLALLKTILDELPPRRRAVLLMARVEALPREEIARRLGVSLRLVSKELRLAHAHCAARWPGPPKT
nr:sigma-70 family RNA polymerase sigma factor [Rhodoplanes tepidamans]